MLARRARGDPGAPGCLAAVDAGDGDRPAPARRRRGPADPPVARPQPDADYHLLVELGWFSLSVDPPVKHARPSIDVLFDTAARAYGARVIGVVLTGASDDGADGAKMIRDRGGTIIVQDPATAMSPIAPKSAIARAGADKVRTLDELPGTLTTLCGVRPRERGNTRPP
jgi:hypothetical protein